MVGVRIRRRGVAFIALGVGAAACQLALDFDYEFAGTAGSDGLGQDAGLGRAGDGGTSLDGGPGGSAGVAVSEGDAGAAITPASAGGGPYLGGAGGAGGSGGAPSASGAAGDGSDDTSADAGPSASAGAAGTDSEPPAPTCTGCIELIIGFESGPEVRNFQLDIGADAAAFDFSVGSIDWTLQALNLDAELGVKLSVQNGEALGYAGLYTEPAVPLVAPEFEAGVWRTLHLDVGAFTPFGENPGAASDNPFVFDKTQVRVLGLEVGVRSDTERAIELHLLIDRVSVNGVPGASVFEFSDAQDGFALHPPEGAQVIYHPSGG